MPDRAITHRVRTVTVQFRLHAYEGESQEEVLRDLRAQIGDLMLHADDTWEMATIKEVEMDEIRVVYGGGDYHFNVSLAHDDPGMVLLDTGTIPEFKLWPEEAAKLAAALDQAAWAALEASGHIRIESPKEEQ